MCRLIEEVEPKVGRHFVGSVPVQAQTRDQPFYGNSEKPPHFSRLLRRAYGDTEDLLPHGPHGGMVIRPKSVIMSISVARSRFSEMSDQWRVKLYMVISQNVL